MNTGIDGNIPLSFNLKYIFASKRGLNMFRQCFAFEYLINFVAEGSDALGILRESNDFFSAKIEKIDANKKEH